MPVAAGGAGQGPGGARPRCGAGGVLEATGRQPDDVAAGKREPGVVLGLVVLGSVPFSGSTRRGQCRWLRSSLRVTPAVGRGAWGGSASGEAVRRGQSRRRPRRRVTAGQNVWRPRALPPAGGGGSCRPPGPGGRRLVGGVGQGADLPVAHPLVE